MIPAEHVLANDDDHVSGLLSRLDVPRGLDDVLKRIAPIDNGSRGG